MANNNKKRKANVWSKVGDVAAIEPHREDDQRKYSDIWDGHKETAILIERSRVQFSLSSIEILFLSLLTLKL